MLPVFVLFQLVMVMESLLLHDTRWRLKNNSYHGTNPNVITMYEGITGLNFN